MLAPQRPKKRISAVQRTALYAHVTWFTNNNTVAKLCFFQSFALLERTMVMVLAPYNFFIVINFNRQIKTTFMCLPILIIFFLFIRYSKFALYYLTTLKVV